MMLNDRETRELVGKLAGMQNRGLVRGAAAWVRCSCCHDDYWCTICSAHVDGCDCPPADEWSENPFEGQMVPHPEGPWNGVSVEIEASMPRDEDKAERRGTELTMTFSGEGPVMDVLRQLIDQS